LLGPFASRNEHTCSTGKVIAVSTFQDSEFPRHKKKKGAVPVRKNTGGNSYQFPRTGSGHPDSRFHASPRRPDFGELDSFQEPARAIQNPDSAPRRGFWSLDRFQDPDIAMQNPTYAPRPAIWKLKDKIQIPNSETAVSVYAPALMPHPILRPLRGAEGDGGARGAAQSVGS